VEEVGADKNDAALTIEHAIIFKTREHTHATTPLPPPADTLAAVFAAED
jgi:hypothetical protein